MPEPPPTSRIAVLLHQVKSPLIYILLVASAVTIAIGEHVDASVIAAVVVLNTVIGYLQERKAEGSVRALMKLIAPRARVMRDGHEREIESRELVVGDIVLLESGARIPADLRLISTTALAIDESLLTGESVPVQKSREPVAPDAVLADRSSMAFTGTVVASGRGRGCVVATGAHTELGKIASQIRREEPAATPLQTRMERFARVVGIAVATGAVAAFGLGLALGFAVSDMFLVAVAVAVSAVAARVRRARRRALPSRCGPRPPGRHSETGCHRRRDTGETRERLSALDGAQRAAIRSWLGHLAAGGRRAGRDSGAASR